MNKNKALFPVSEDSIQERIYLIRGRKIMLDNDLARLYGVKTFRLNEAVKRNIRRFPEDFMFQLTNQEFTTLKDHWKNTGLISQIAISSSTWGGRRHAPYAFTEQGVAMLSSVLNSERAVQVNIAIMRTFVKLRQRLSTHRELFQKLGQLEQRIDSHDGEIRSIFEAMRQLMAKPERPKRRIGFHP